MCGGSTTVQAPNANETTAQALSAEMAAAPGMFNLAQQYAPQYSDLYSQIAQSSLFGDATSSGLLSTYSSAAPVLQGIQSAANAQQAQANVNLVNNLGQQATQAFQGANPQLTGINTALFNYATSGQNPVSGLNVAGSPNISLAPTTSTSRAASTPASTSTIANYNPLQGLQLSMANLGSNNITQGGAPMTPVNGGTIATPSLALPASGPASPILSFPSSSTNGGLSSPTGLTSQIGGWATPFAQQVQNSVNGNQVQGTNLGFSANAPIAGNTNLGFSANTPLTSGANLNWGTQAPGTVSAGSNATVNQLNQTAQQQLALGGSLSPQQQATLSNEVLSNYNSMGRANDPTAIAGLATGLDTYSNQLLQQREQNAANAGSLQAQQQGLGLTAGATNQQANLAIQGLGLNAAQTQSGYQQQANLANQLASLQAQGQNLTAAQTQAGLTQQTALANQAANLQAQGLNLNAAQTQAGLNQQAALADQAAVLQGLGLTGTALTTGGAQQLSGATADQQAQMQNAQYQAGLLGMAGSQLANTAVNPFAAILGQSGALGAASGAAGQAMGSSNAGQQLMNEYNPFTNGTFNTIYGGNLSANQATASNNAALTGGAMSALSGIGGAALGAMT